MTIGERIKLTRKKRNLSQSGLGELLGVTQATVQQYESGKRNPKIETIKRIARALDVDANYLMHGYTLEERDRAYKEKIAKRMDALNSEQSADTDLPKYFFATEGYGMYAFNTEEERDKARDALSEAINKMNGKQRDEVLRYAQYLLDKDTPD